MKVEPLDLRASIDQALAAGAWPLAQMQLAQLWAAEPSPATANYVTGCFHQLKAHSAAAPLRLFILRSFTLEPVIPLLRASAAVNGIDLTVQLGEFNAFDQEILTANCPLYSSLPNVVILAVQTRDAAPELWERFTDLSPEEIRATADRLVEEMRHRIQSFRQHSDASLIVHGFETPAWPAAGLWDAQHACSQVETIRSVNQRLQELARDHAGVFFLDYDSLIARVGRLAWHDARKWLTMRMPIAAAALGSLAGEWLRFIRPLTGRTCKAIVTDLDNTIWGGVVGEDGMDGLKLGSEYPGAAYLEVQRALLDLRHRGILLAICSKNNPPDALEVLEKHPGMLLRSSHFSAQRINWTDKAQNLREIAAELNIGIDALAFLDDNPTERQRVRLELPEVTVIDLPDNPMAFASTLRQHPALEKLTISAEDRERSRFYTEQHGRAALQKGAGSVEEFLRSLSQQIEITPVSPATRARVAQLTQKTNQFNLTTRRYDEHQIAAFVASAQWLVLDFSLADVFGDSGIVGLAMVDLASPQAARLDTFLMSCRVIGRCAEDAFMHTVLCAVQRRGFGVLHASFRPTAKNDLVQGLLPRLGFQPDGRADGDYLRDLANSPPQLADGFPIQIDWADRAEPVPTMKIPPQ